MVYQLKVEMIFVAKVHFMIEEEENLGYHIGSTVYIRIVSLLSALLHWFIGCLQSQGRHGWTGLQGGLVWILQNRKRGRQQLHAADVVAAVGATVSNVCSTDWPKKDSANFESQNFEGP